MILDEYSVHTSELIKTKQENGHIGLIYVPSGRTPYNQPLDVSINGNIKIIGKKLITQLHIEDPYIKIDIAVSMSALINVNNQIKKTTIINSFHMAYILDK